MADEVKLYAVGGSPFVCRVKIGLNLKGIKYQNLEEDLSNKSSDLVKYNPVHKKVPVLVHNGKPVSESLVILEYIEDVWKGVPILPQDPYEKSVARFWGKFIDDKLEERFHNEWVDYFLEGRSHEWAISQLEGRFQYDFTSLGLFS